MNAILLRTESATSSQIENLTGGARQLALEDLDQSTRENAKSVIGNVRALEAAQHRSDAQAGTYRGTLVWVGSSAVAPIGACHVAPQAEHVATALDD